MKRDDIRESIDNSYSKICTFSPQTNSKQLVFNENSKLVYKRLFDDHARRKYNSHLNSKKIESECENLANKKHLKNFDKKRIEKLYLDHKKNKVHKTTMQKQFDEIAGMTFKPSIPNADKYEISNDFHQRNDILLHKKNIFSDWYQKILKENFDTNHKNYTSEQVEEIKNSIVERLYKKDLEKILNKKSINDNVEKDKFDYKADLRSNQFFNSEFSQNYNNNKSNLKSTNKKTTNQQNTSRSKSKNSARNILNINTNNNILNNNENKKQTSNVNINTIGMRFSFKNENNLKILENNLSKKDDPNLNYLGNSDNESNFNTIKNINNNLTNLSGNNNQFDSNNNLNLNSKTDDYTSNNEESVITEIENNIRDNKESARRIRNKKTQGANDNFYQNPEDYLNLNFEKNLTNEDLTTDKKFKTINHTNSTNGNNNVNNTQQNRNPRDSEALLKHFLNNNNKNTNRTFKDQNSNENQIANSERMHINSINNDQNSNLMLNHISLASPLNLLSTKSTNNYVGNSSIKNVNNASYSNMDHYNGESMNHEFETINQDHDNHFN